MNYKNLIKENVLKMLPSYLEGGFHAINNYRIGKKVEAIHKKNNNRIIKDALSSNKPIQLELGAFIPRQGWLTVDLLEDADLKLNLTKSLPFPDNSVDKIYSSHVFEHFYYEEGLSLLRECYRVLKKDGTFSICVPNAAIYLNAYFQPESFDVKKFCVYTPAFHYTTRIDYINYMAYMGGQHRYMWDEENLLAIIKKSGFNNVKLRSFNPELDKSERDHESLYALAIK